MLNGILSPSGSDELGWDDIQRRRKLADALMAQSSDYSPVGSWTQGLARVAQGLVGGYEAGKMAKEEKAANQPINEAIAAYLRGGASPSPVAPSQAMTTADAAPKAPGMAASGGANLPGDMATWASAIRKKESAGSGDYAAIGPTHPTMGRALGAYQVMESNIGPWSREAVGREVTPDEFLRNPQIQDQIFQHKFGQYVQKYGNPQDAASAWFTGRPLAQGANARDVLGTTGAQYVADFNRNAGVSGAPAQAAPAPTQVASLDGLPPGPVASDAPPMAYAGPQPSMSGMTPPMPPARPPGLSEAPAAPDAPAPSAAPAGPAPQRVAQALMPQAAAPGAGPDPRTALLAAALSGRANPALAQKAMMLYQLVDKPQFQFQAVGDSLYRIDPRKGTAEAVPGVNATKATDEQREYQLARSQGYRGTFFDYKTELARARGTQVNVNPGEKEADKVVGKAEGERRVKVEGAWSAVPDRLQRIELAKTLLGGIQTGRMAGFQGSIADWALGMGVNPRTLEAMGIDPKLPATEQSLASEVNRSLVGMIGQGGFPANNFSNADRDFLTRIFPSIANRPEANALILEVQRRAADQELRAAEDWQQAREAGKSFSQWEREYAGKVRGQNMFADLADQIKAISPPKQERQMTPQERALEELRRRSRT